MGPLKRLKFFSVLHRAYAHLVLERIREYYADRLLALAIYGSYARGDNRMNSDLDLLIVLRGAPGRRERIEEFIREVEMFCEPRAQELYERDHILCELSPMLLVEEEAAQFQPIYSDMVESCVILVDHKGLLRRILDSVQRLLHDTRARKVRRNNTWEWQYGTYLGGVKL
ncbi:nucleotidyltransferase domain-containing protein [Kyrpidia tusciae]|uniref:DNA polymerase beta domain protein region n=1 Tax=Kyrpidia tusciae (strain DSM 2912 / NBRC 15312 / T2) TaxID=562970 RepID=D5WWZ9_KYRT2|nr:nucleotidyltransferase domain-containing protein [Kyrpidia tusciae]ADG05850.1 DNA polymerase beta domain protein region [Kyrpidia tusciae DSM 2912]